MMDTRNILWTVAFGPRGPGDRARGGGCAVRSMALAVVDVAEQGEGEAPLVSPMVEPFGTIDDALFGHTVCSIFCLPRAEGGGADVYVV